MSPKFGNKVSANTQTFDFTPKPFGEFSRGIIKPNLSREAEYIKNLDLDLIYNTSISNFYERPIINGLSNQRITNIEKNSK